MLKGMPHEEEWDKDNYGKVIGNIVDAKTGKPVNEFFYISIFECSNAASPKDLGYFKTDKRGYFEQILNPGIYNLEFCPESFNSLYEMDPAITRIPIKQTITIKKGQITKFIKKAEYGAWLLVRFLDQNNNPLNMQNFLGKNGDIDIFVMNEVYDYVRTPDKRFISKKDNADLNDGEYLIRCLYPQKIELLIKFGCGGYGSLMSEEMEIERGQTNEMIIVIDTNDHTGVEGIIVDELNRPIKNVRVGVSGQNSACVGTDDNGYYKIVGLKAGEYSLNIFKVVEGGFINDRYEIVIKPNEVLKKDIKYIPD
jgi:hypothetical protein